MTTRRDFNMLLLSTAAGACIAPLAGCSTIKPKSSTMAIDSHAHVFLRNLPMPDRRRAPSGYDAPPEDYLRILEANSMTHGVLVQPSFLGIDNSYLMESLRKFPDRFRGIAVVAPTVSSLQLDTMQHAGVVGIRLNLVGLPTPDFSSTAWQQLFKELLARNWLVEVHQVGRELKLTVDTLLSAGLNVVVDHFGRPDPKLGVDDPGFQYLLTLGSTQRVWIKISGAYRNGPNGRGLEVAKAAMPLLKQHFGINQLLWGSDWPHTLFEKTVTYADQRRIVEELLPDINDRQIVLNNVPAKLFAFAV